MSAERAERLAAEALAAVRENESRPKPPPKRIVIHRGPIPGTDQGHHWFTDVYGERYGILGWPHGINKGWGYEVIDAEGRMVTDGLFSHDEIRDWARS